jgi:YD repeat-containing protein
MTAMSSIYCIVKRALVQSAQCVAIQACRAATLALLVALISGGAPVTASAVTYSDCQQYGGTKVCKDPEKTPWRMGADTLYFNNVVPFGAAAYCATLRAEKVAAGTPDMAVSQYVGLFNSQMIDDCLLDISSISQQSLCGFLPESVVLFDTTIQNRQGYPYWGRQVIAIPTCDVRQWSLNYPGYYYQAPYPWRDACGAKSQAVQAPSGRVLCAPDDPKKEDKDKPECKDAKGNPIDVSNGNKFEPAVDYTDARGDLTFKRYYNSNVDSAGMLGRAWSSEYDARVYYNADAVQYGGTAVLLARRGTGAQVPMAPIATDLFAPVSRDLSQRVKVLRDSQGVTGFVLYDGTSVEQYDSFGRLTKLLRADGYARTVSRDFDERVTAVTDSFGRRLEFTYVNTASRKGYYVDTMKTPRGLFYSFSYSQVGPDARLLSVVKPDGKSVQYVYDTANRLAGRLDEFGFRFSTFEYDSNGDAIGTRHATDINLVQSTRTAAPDGSVTVAINDRGVQTTRQYADVDGRKVLVSQSNPAGSGCAAATKAIAYDANLNPTQVDEFGGARVCAVFDQSRNLRLVEVRGLSSSAVCSAVLAPNAPLSGTAAKRTLEWHPDIERPTRIASPLNLAYFVYNGQPDPTNGGQVASCAPTSALLPDGKPIVVLCKTVERATTDTSGALGFAASLDSAVPARVMNFTYNGAGQLATQTDGRGFSTSFLYQGTTSAVVTAGDLISVAPQVGLSTSFTEYNADGFLKSMSDSNGLVTTFDHDLINRTTRSTVGSLTTTLTYDDKGRLRQVQGPSGESATYTYDDADRLTRIEDGSGNSISKVLDSAGNVVREEYKDPSGVLKRWLERGFDGLNRLSRIKGVALQQQ